MERVCRGGLEYLERILNMQTSKHMQRVSWICRGVLIIQKIDEYGEGALRCRQVMNTCMLGLGYAAGVQKMQRSPEHVEIVLNLHIESDEYTAS